MAQRADEDEDEVGSPPAQALVDEFESKMRSGSVVPLVEMPDENTPEQNDLIARLRASLPECVAKYPEPVGT